MEYHSKYTGPEIESLLDKVNNNDIITVDNRLSSTSINPVQNKVVKAALDEKQDTLESGYNIKTINGKSILGYGNIEIQGGTGGEGVSESEVNDLIEEKLSTKNYATKSEVNVGLKGKQDAISDLATIRSGAAKGATSVQSDDLAAVATSGSYSDLSNKPTIPSAYDDSELRGIVEKLENNSPYITDFSVSDLWNSVDSGESFEIDKEKLRAAFRESRFVLVPELNDMDAGYRIATGYSEDLLYITVLLDWSTVYYIETNYETNIIYPNEIYYTRFQSELKSGKNIKTINGKSILGSGDLDMGIAVITDFAVSNLYGWMGEDIESRQLSSAYEQHKLILVPNAPSGECLVPLHVMEDDDYNIIITVFEPYMIGSILQMVCDKQSFEDGVIRPLRKQEFTTAFRKCSRYLEPDTIVVRDNHGEIDVGLIRDDTGFTWAFPNTDASPDADGVIQERLKSGTNIKTINGESILGDGNITIVGGDLSEDEIKGIVGEMVDEVVDSVVGDKLEGKVEKNQVGELNLALVDGLDNRSLAYALPDSANGDEDDVLLSRDTVKTVNGKSIYGKGNIYIPEYDDTFIDDRVRNLEAAIVSKADKEGVYPEMSVGLAEDLGGRPFFEDAEFVFRASAGEDYSIKDGLATIKEIKGNSVVWNQKFMPRAASYTACGVEAKWENGSIRVSGTYNNNGDPNLYSLIKIDSSTIGNKFAVIPIGEKKYTIYVYGGFASTFCNNGAIVSVISSQTFNVTLRPKINYPNPEVIDETITPIAIDLTQMFGAGNEPTTIEEFYARIPSGVDMNAYNAGEVISMNTESIKSVGENAWDEQWANGYWNTVGRLLPSDTAIASVNPIKVLPNEQYFVNNKDVLSGSQTITFVFYDRDNKYISEVVLNAYKDGIVTVPSNAERMALYVEGQTVYNNNIMISLVHSGWKQDVDAGYQPYWEDRLDLSVIGKYFPQGMKKAGSAYDEIRFNKASGKWEAVQRVTSLDLGSLAWLSAAEGHFYVENVLGNIVYRNLLCPKYTIGAGQYSGMAQDKTIGNNYTFPYNQSLFVRDDDYNDAASFKAAMAGVMLYYELAEPIVTEIAEDIELVYDVADFGTEEAIASVPSTPFRARIMYDFNANDSIRNNSVGIRDLKKRMATKEDVAEAIAAAITTTLNTEV